MQRCKKRRGPRCERLSIHAFAMASAYTLRPQFRVSTKATFRVPRMLVKGGALQLRPSRHRDMTDGLAPSDADALA